MKWLSGLNTLVASNLRLIETIGVLMRITSFSLFSWFGPDSPFLIVWVVNSIDALLLSWCSIIKRDVPYTILNVFWVGVGIVGIVRATGFSHP